MKRLSPTFITSLLLSACAGEVASPSPDAGVVESNDNARVESDGGRGEAPADSNSSSEPAVGASGAEGTSGDERSSSTASSSSGGGSNGGFSSNSSNTGNPSLPGTADPTWTSSVQTNDGTAVDTASEQTLPSDGTTTTTDTDPVQSGDENGSTDDPTNESDAATPEPGFDIDLVFLDESESSTAVVESFERAEAFWEELIIGDLPDITTRRQACNGPDIYVEGEVDDLQIFVAVGVMDGPDGVLGAAGPCLGRPTLQGGLPLAGFMQFDVEDLERYAEQGRLDEVVIHEMGHVLGFGGVMWQEQGYLADPSDENVSRDTHFTGEKAIAAFDAIGGNAYADAKVPVENTGGQGTANGHWREEVMGNEMMTSYMTHLEAVLSTVTLAALEDMGYVVDYSKAGGYEWPPPDERSSPFSLRTEPAPAPIDFGDDILDIPFVTVD